MLPNDKNKLNKLEELKSKLFRKSYQTKIEHRDVYYRPHKKDLPDSWGGGEKVKSDVKEEFFMETSVFKKFFIFSIIFFILALGYAAYVFFGGGNTVSNDNIEISVLGNNFTDGGEELPLIIEIVNKNNSPLDLVDLVVEYPKSSAADLSSDVERLRMSLGTIPAGTVHSENFKIVLFGEQGSIRPVKISIEYRVAGSNAIFVKDKLFEVNINSTPINLSVDAPLTVTPNQEIVLNIKETLNATEETKNILLKVDYPVGFSFGKSVPAPSFGNNIWDLGDLAPGIEHNIVISGKMIDVFDGEEKTFNIATGSQSEVDKSVINVVFNSMKNTMTIKKPFVEANLFVNGVSQKEYAVDTKTVVIAEIRYANNLETKVNDLQIEAKISGNAFDRKTVKVQQGFYDSSNDVITWNQNSQNALAEVNPGDSGIVSFSFSPRSLFSSEEGIITDPSVNIEINILGKQEAGGFAVNEIRNSSSALIRIISDIVFSAKALYFSGPFANTGPIPPQAGQITTYTIVWTLSNTANNISKAQINSSLPPWITFMGQISPANENLIYNASTRGIVWNVDKIPKGAGITGDSRSVSFQVSSKFSISQIGTTPLVINDAILTGHDDFANVNIKISKTGLNTRLDSDPAFPLTGAEVAQ